jgi:hypothetical protein
MITASALPLVQPGRSMICWTMAARSEVRWSGLRAPTVGHGTGVQPAVAEVSGRDEMFLLLLENVAGTLAPGRPSAGPIAADHTQCPADMGQLQ